MKWKSLIILIIGFLTMGTMVKMAIAAPSQELSHDVVLAQRLQKELGINIKPEEVAIAKKITAKDLKMIDYLQSQGVKAPKEKLLKLITTIKVANLIAEKTDGNPLAVFKYFSILGNKVQIEHPVGITKRQSVLHANNILNKNSIVPLSGDYADLHLDMWVGHIYQDDPDIPYYIIVHNAYWWRETEASTYEGSDDVLYFIWDEAGDLVLFNDKYPFKIRRADSALGAIAYYAPDDLNSGYVYLYLLPKTPDVSGRYTRVSMNYVHTYGIGGSLSVTVGYKYVSVTYSPKIGGKWKKSTYVTFKIDPWGELK
ncbi:hypothetical protein PAP_07100 [Palaeococcus pacificus DY20341]|uniref:Uncharacterized protein n=1 Tax=Palaeococcus pacificus DY20341 TaxID=1343739 RepID=A0A075LST1_9EURY|nr:hypothetical protein [Palaeococcus pacificus]AIF69810.1 hypothetical protein PAP_07100 [Palaeococcus pacificus DY20341]